MRALLNNCDLFYTVEGTGPPVALVHGFPLDHSIWTPQIGTLSRDFRILAPDLRGHGQSEATADVYSMKQLARDVKSLLDNLGIEQFVLMGLSMGGYVAFAFLREFGGMVQGLILSDTKAEADSDEAKARREQQAVEVLRDGTKPMADRLITGMLADRTRERDPVLTGQVYEMMRSQKPVGMAGALRGMASRPDSTEILDSIRVPTLIMVGEEDTVTPVADSRRMADRIVGSELVVIPGSAHLTSLERPDTVNSAVRTFLERVSK